MLNARSEKNLVGVDSGLAAVVRRAHELSTVKFTVIEGVRTKARQAELYAKGRTTAGPIVTWTMESKHIHGKAVDLLPDLTGWNDPKAFDEINRAMVQASKELKVKIRWGADWDRDGKPREKGETDSPHWELD